jgi:hypothetical protein
MKMSSHPSVRTSFFIRFLLFTIVLGNIYVGLQALAHSFNFHALDMHIRWYAFKAAPWWNLLLLVGVLITLRGAQKIYKNGPPSFYIYLLGKIICMLAWMVLSFLEYRISGLPYPIILLPVIMGLQGLYPMVLYLSLRKSKTRK